MIWGLLGLILVLVLLGLALTNSNVGRVLPVAFVIVIGIIGYFAWYQNHEMSVSKKRIPASEVELVDMQVTKDTRDRQITGRVRNHSQEYTLTQVKVRVSIEDCADSPNGHCDVINQKDITLNPNVPPGQARDFREPLYFSSPLAVRGKLKLKYDVVTTQGE